MTEPKSVYSTFQKKASQRLRLELMNRAIFCQVRSEKIESDVPLGEFQRHSDHLFAAYVIAQTIRDGFVFVAKAIRQSIDEPRDY